MARLYRQLRRRPTKKKKRQKCKTCTRKVRILSVLLCCGCQHGVAFHSMQTNLKMHKSMKFSEAIYIDFLSRISTLTRDIDIAVAVLSASRSVYPSARHVPVFCRNGLIYCLSSSPTIAQAI